MTNGAQAAILTPTADDYLLIGRGSDSVGVAVKVSSSNALGRIYTVPSPTNPDVDDSPPWPLPTGATAPTTGITNDGNVAVTHNNGTYDFSGIDIYADIGVRAPSGARAGWSSSSLISGTFANDATGMANIETELDAAKVAINGLSGTNGWTLNGTGSKSSAGVWNLDSDGVDTNTTITLASGLNVIIIDTDENAMKINNAGLVIDGPADSEVVFLLEDQDEDFLFTNASITHGQNGIGPNAILFAVLDGDNGSNFDFSKVIVNGAAFWDLSEAGGQINMDNVQGCGQWVGDHLNFNDVQLARCAHGVPEPTSLALLSLGGLLIVRRRRG